MVPVESFRQLTDRGKSVKVGSGKHSRALDSKQAKPPLCRELPPARIKHSGILPGSGVKKVTTLFVALCPRKGNNLSEVVNLFYFGGF